MAEEKKLELGLESLSDKALQHIVDGNLDALTNDELEIVAASEEDLGGGYEPLPPTVVEEQSPLVSNPERILQKALGSPEDIYRNLREKLGKKAEVVIGDPSQGVSSPEGRLFIAERGSNKYYPLDPEKNSIGEYAKDIAEASPEILSVLAGLATGGAGYGLAAAGAAGGIEAARQGLGKAFGVRRDVSPGDIAGTAAGSLAGTALMGASAPMVKSLGTQEIKGLLPALGRHVRESVGAMATQVPKRMIRELPRFLPQLEEWEKLGAINPELKKKVATQIAKVYEKSQQIGGELGAAREGVEEAIDLEPVIAPLLKEKERLRKISMRDEFTGEFTPAAQESIESINTLIHHIFGGLPPEGLSEEVAQEAVKSTGKVRPEVAVQLKQLLKKPAGIFKAKGKELTPPDEKMLRKGAQDAIDSIDAQIDLFSKGKSGKLSLDYKKLQDAKETIEDLITPDKQVSLLKKLSAAGRDQEKLDELVDVDKITKTTNLSELAQTAEVFDKLGIPKRLYKGDAPKKLAFRPPSKEALTRALFPTALSGAGFYGAYGLGADYGDARLLGAALGVGLGPALASRAGIRAVTKYGPTAGKVFDRSVVTPLKQSIWSLMQPEARIPEEERK